MRVGREIEYIDTNRLRGEENGAKVIIYNVYSGEMRVGGYNRVEEGIDGGKSGCVGPYIVCYVYLVSAYRPSISLASSLVSLWGSWRGV